MDDLAPSKRITRGTPLHAKVRKNVLKNWNPSKKNDSIALQEVINNAKASGIKIVEGGIKRKAKDNNSMEAVSASLDQDKYEEHRVFA
ncbi:hypothetical protein H5410_036795 [Solanum commersonii]|uniref:Uncharacterized protein n=1 Tax=Solanum commersonii TaxID=4109 RepID=A0A9J5Y4I1_SOLCO|nr:hypothetical protein H5410_036795 [Solanum commersonii]